MSNLARFGIDPTGDPAKQIPKICAVLEAILNNPDHLVGNSRSLIRFPSIKSAGAPLPSNPGAIPPFHVFFHPTTSEISVSHGLVCERVPGTSDGLILHEPLHLLYTAEEEDLGASPPKVAGKPKRHAISAGESVCIRVEVLEPGAIGKTTEPVDEIVILTVLEAPPESVHYIPPVAGDPGSPGYYIYKLATLVSVDPLVLEPFLTGSHIDHFRERHMAENVGGGAEVLKDYDADADAYRYRTFIAGLIGTDPGAGAGQISITQNGDTLEVRGNSLDAEFHFVEPGASAPSTGEEINFGDGLNLDGEVPGEPPPVPKRIVLPVVLAGAGISVTRDGEGDREFTVAATGSGGGHLNLECYDLDVSSVIASGTAVFPWPPTLYQTLYFRNGAFIGDVDPDGGVPPAGLIIREIFRLTP